MTLHVIHVCVLPHIADLNQNEFVRARRRCPCTPGSVLQATILFYKAPRCTTTYNFVVLLCIPSYDFLLPGTTLYYKLHFCSTRNHSVLQATILCYKVPRCPTSYDFVLQGTALYYKLRVWTTRYHSVLQVTILWYHYRLQATILHCKVPLCTTNYDFVL